MIYFMMIGMWLTMISAWFTHIYWAVSLLMVETILTTNTLILMLAGLFPPVGMVHGVILWVQ